MSDIRCLDDQTQSYELYLPRTYTSDRQWPVLFCFEPAARGSIPVELFVEAAEMYGYIIISSNNSRNGPWEPIKQAAEAVWRDASKRFSLNPARIYAVGFSGGSRAASHFQYIIKRPAAGVIGCGAGLSTTLKPAMLLETRYFGIVGLEDFNYREMTALDDAFDTTNVVHCLLIIDGGHRWPPTEICTQALEWMELNGMKQGLRKKEDLLINRLYKKALRRADQLEKMNRIFEAWREYRDTVQLFDGLLDIAQAGQKADALKQGDVFKDFMKAELDRHERELKFIGSYARARRLFLSDTPLQVRQELIYQDIKLDALRKEANQEGENVNIYDRALSRRLLYELRVNAVQNAGEFLQRKDYRRAAYFYDIAVHAGTEHPTILYNLACAYSMLKNKKEALKALKLAVEKGFDNVQYMLTDKDLTYIRKTKGFKKILQDLKK